MQSGRQTFCRHTTTIEAVHSSETLVRVYRLGGIATGHELDGRESDFYSC
jgi:hypothetical protein